MDMKRKLQAYAQKRKRDTYEATPDANTFATTQRRTIDERNPKRNPSVSRETCGIVSKKNLRKRMTKTTH
jgi:hypothetical protein